MFPPKSLYIDVLNEDLFMNLSPTGDDIWFWAMAVLKGTKIKLVGNNISDICVINGTQNNGLWETVNSFGQNDIHLNRIIRTNSLMQYVHHIPKKC